MHRPPDVENLADFIQYYRGAYIGWQGDEPGIAWVPAHVRGMSEREGLILDINGKPPEEVSFKTLLRTAQFGSPQYGSAEIGTSCVYAWKRAARTQNRGHRGGSLGGHVFSEDVPQGWTNNLDYLRFLFNPQYRTLPEAVARINSAERRACSLSRYFTLAATTGYSVPCLFYKARLIGFVPAQDKIELENPEEYSALVLGTFPYAEVS